MSEVEGKVIANHEERLLKMEAMLLGKRMSFLSMEDEIYDLWKHIDRMDAFMLESLKILWKAGE